MKKTKTVVFAAAAIIAASYADSASADSQTYTIKRGDTLSAIAYKSGTTVAALKQMNSLKSDIIYPNQVLKLTKTATVPTVAKPKANTPSGKTTTAKTYKVVSGDNLSKIAAKHKVTVANLLTWNNLKSTMIYPNQVLNVSNSSSTTQPITSPAPPKNANPTKPSPTTVNYVVKRGDTLGQIGKAYGVSVAQLKQMNNLKSDMIYVGQKLVLSGKSATKPVAKPSTPVKENDGNLIGSSAFTNKLIAESKKVLGVKYVFGGTTVKGFDCSGFIYYAFNQAGYKINRQSAAGYYDRSYYVDKPQPGDLVFFENTYKKGISHLGIYLGNNEFINADNSGVRIVSLNNSYYKKHFSSFKRFY